MEKLIDNRNDFITRLFPWILVLMPILYPYKLFNLYLPLSILSIYAFVLIIVKRKFYVYKPYAYLSILMILMNILKMVIVQDFSISFIYNILELLLIFFITTVISQNAKMDNIYKVYKKIGVVVCLGIYYQAFLIFILKMNTYPIKILPIDSGRFSDLITRPTSFFQEPASFILFIIPLIYIALTRKDWLVIIVSSIAVVFSTSTSGVLLLILLFFIYNTKIEKYNINILAMLLLGAVFGVGFFYLDVFSASKEKLLGILAGGGTFNIRVLLGPEIFLGMPLLEKFIGITNSNISNYIYMHLANYDNLPGLIEYFWHYREKESFYLSTNSGVLIRYGLLGISLYINLLYKLYRDSNSNFKYFIWIIIIAGFGMNFYYSRFFIMYMWLILSQVDRNKNFLKFKL